MPKLREHHRLQWLLLACAVLVFLLAAPKAVAAGNSMTISTNPTSHGSCVSGHWTPSADNANLNVNDIASCVVSGSVTIGNSGTIDVQGWPSSLPDSVTLDGNSTIDSPTPTGPANSITGLTIDGTATIGTEINTNGGQVYTAAVELDGDATFASAPGDVTFDSTIDGAHALIVSSGGPDYFMAPSVAPPDSRASKRPLAAQERSFAGASPQLAARPSTAIWRSRTTSPSMRVPAPSFSTASCPARVELDGGRRWNHRS